MNLKLDHESVSFILVILVLSQIQCSFSQPNQLHETCKEPFKCGDGEEHGYPFWGNNRPAACGYPGFELNCLQGDGAVLLNISGVPYRVLKIEEDEFRLTVARQDMWEDVCRPDIFLLNSTLNFNLFSLFPASGYYRNITLNYGCVIINTAQPPQQTAELTEFNCTLNELNSLSLIISTPEASVELTRIWKCDGIVSVPLDRNTASGFFSVGASVTAVTLDAALRVGFSIQWSAENANCKKCEESGGVCGFNQGSESFACHCIDRSYGFTCNDTRTGNGNDSNKTGLIVGLPIAGAVLAGVGVGLIVFYCNQRRKRQIAAVSAQTASREMTTTTTTSSKGLSSPSSTNFDSSVPSYPSSKSDLDRGSMYFGVHVFDYTELEKATNNFDPSRELGDGGFGTVYYGLLGDGSAVAVKRLYENNVKRADQFMNEVEILTRLKHQNLVKLHGCTSKRSKELLLVYEYIPNGTVADHLHGKRSKSLVLTWPVRLNIAVETADALAYLHRSEIIHRDVKTSNVLLDNEFHVKVADFGLSRLFPTNVTHVSTAPQGTPGYVDPEYYRCYQLTEKSDVYSFGVMLIELVSSLQAVDTSRHRQDINLANMAINKIQNRALNELVDPSLGFESNDRSIGRAITLVSELAFGCLQQEREGRPSMEKVLETLRGIQNGHLNAHRVDIVGIS